MACYRQEPFCSCHLSGQWIDHVHGRHARNTRADQGLAADELEGEADQDWREGGEPRTLCCLPNRGGRHPTTNVPGDSAADRGTTAAATTRASMKRSIVTRSRAMDRRNASRCQ